MGLAVFNKPNVVKGGRSHTSRDSQPGHALSASVGQYCQENGGNNCMWLAAREI